MIPFLPFPVTLEDRPFDDVLAAELVSRDPSFGDQLRAAGACEDGSCVIVEVGDSLDPQAPATLLAFGDSWCDDVYYCWAGHPVLIVSPRDLASVPLTVDESGSIDPGELTIVFDAGDGIVFDAGDGIRFHLVRLAW
ncbi:MAG: hypothetical protein KC621_25815 [Myxococcales bacterium]|nr:hypothetical protein [Myxococcales bacterium]